MIFNRIENNFIYITIIVSDVFVRLKAVLLGILGILYIVKYPSINVIVKSPSHKKPQNFFSLNNI